MASLIDKYFSRADFDAIEAAVKRAEQSTDGEIAVQLASHSHHWNLERWVHALAFTLTCMIVALYLTREINWGVYYSTTQAVLWGGIGFVVAYFGWGRYMRRGGRRRAVVWKRSLGIFQNLAPVRGLAGVLVFVSLEEDQAAIVADAGIASKVTPDFWDRVHAGLVAAMKQSKHAEGVIEAIETIAVELARHFPRTSDDVNELPDRPKALD